MGAGVELAKAAASMVAQGPPSQEYSGIAMALNHLAPVMTDADTSRNLRWQREVDGDTTKLTMWKLEATASPGLHFYAYMQPGEAFMVVGHSMSTIYSTMTDITTFHGKVVLFTGDHKGTSECIPVILSPQSAFRWKKCLVIDNKEKLLSWYADHPSEYGNLWDPTANDGQQVELQVPRMIALPLQAASLYHQVKGVVMPHSCLTPWNSIWQAPPPPSTMGAIGDWSRSDCSLRHRRMGVVGTQPSPSLSLISARTPFCPTMISSTGG
jgi:hypothetical protein